MKLEILGLNEARMTLGILGINKVRWPHFGADEEIITARYTQVCNITIIQNYAPIDAAELQDKENLYSESKLNATVDKVRKGDIRICIGDFNAKIDSDNTNYERFMGRHDLEEMNENG